MVRIRHTRDTSKHYVFSQRYEFPVGERVVDIDGEDAFHAVEHPDLEFAADDAFTTDYDALRRAAVRADDADAVNGNSSKADLVDWFDGLAVDRRRELLADDADAESDDDGPERGGNHDA